MTSQTAPHTETLRHEVQYKYAELAENPDRTYHFHHGRPLAEILGYPMEMVDAMPAQAVESFAGVGNPFSVGALEAGQTVLDIGSGAGFDSFIAAQAVGPSGKVIGVDMTDAMLDKARDSAKLMGLSHVEFRHGYIEELPVPDDSIDVAISNGVINLSSDKYLAFREIFRTVKPGGRLFLSDIVVHVQQSAAVKEDVDLWTA